MFVFFVFVFCRLPVCAYNANAAACFDFHLMINMYTFTL